MSKGIYYMLISTFLFSLMQLLVKKLYYIPFFEIIFFRAIISFIISYASVKKEGISIWGNNKKLLILRGIFGTASLTSFFYALHHVPLASAITIVNIKPLLILVVAYFFLKEKINRLQWLCFAMSFAGIAIVKGFDNRIDTLGLLSVLGAAGFAGIAHTIVRLLRETDKPSVIIFYFTLITLPIITPITIYYWYIPEKWDWLILISIGIITHYGQLFLTKAYQSENMSKVSNIYYLGIVFAVAYGYFFFDETYTIATAAGLALIIGGILFNMKISSKHTT